MRKFALLAASSAGALFMTVVAVPNQADAMTFSKPDRRARRCGHRR